MTGARDVILARVRAALADVPPDEGAFPDPASDERDATRSPGLVRRAQPRTVQLFADRVADYRAHVTRVPDKAGEICAAVTQACVRHGVTRLAVPHDLDATWLPAGIELLLDDRVTPLSHADLDGVDGVLTACALAIAQTGTIVLDSGPGQGRRVTTLLPDLHVCIVRAPQIVAEIPDAISALAATMGRPGRPVTLVSGPSATSDIELERVEGVHGPRRLEIVLAA